MLALCSRFTSRWISFLPHQFSAEEAARRFTEEYAQRIFAPLPSIDHKEGVVPYANPIKKVLLSAFTLKVKIRSTKYQGEYGKNHTSVRFDSQGKAHTNTVTVWHDTKGTLGPAIYQGMIYGGLNWDAGLVEQALADFDHDSELQPFDLKSVEPGIMVDPFLIRSEFAQEMGMERVNSDEKARAIREIEKRKWCDDAHVSRLDSDIEQFKLTSCLLPAYILEYPNTPPRIMPAFSQEVKIVGPAPLSITKMMSVTGVAIGALSLLFPQVSLAARAVSILVSTLAGGFFAKVRPTLQNNYYRTQIEEKAHENDKIAESPADKKRREATQGAEPPAGEYLILNIPLRYMLALGLDPKIPVTKDEVLLAFSNRIQLVHPDRNLGADAAEQTRNLIEAKRVALEAFQKRKGFTGDKSI